MKKIKYVIEISKIYNYTLERSANFKQVNYDEMSLISKLNSSDFTNYILPQYSYKLEQRINDEQKLKDFFIVWNYFKRKQFN